MARKLFGVEVAAFVISLVALGLAGWSAWGTHRQARATESQASAAAEANRTAREAVVLAQAADDRERARRDLEETPLFEVKTRHQHDQPEVVLLSIRNRGSLTYEGLVVRPDMRDSETSRLVLGMGNPVSLLAEMELGASQPGESLTAALIRADPEIGGKVKVVVTAYRSRREWSSVHYVTLRQPPRVIVL